MGNYLTNAEQIEARSGQLASETASPSELLSRILVAGVVLILPIVVVVYSKFPLYNPVGYLDPWFYTGYFNNLAELYKWFGPTYYLSRLPWIVPGYIAYHVLPAKWAYFALHGCFLYLGGILMYLLLRSRYDRYVGIVGFALLVANPLYLMSHSWEYVDGAGIVYLLAGMYFFDGSRRWKSGYLGLGLAGALWMFAVNCNFVLIIFAGSYLCAHIYPERITTRLLKQLAVIATGSFLSIVFLGALNHFLIGGSYLFFQTQLLTAKGLMTSGDLAKYKMPLWSLVKSEYRVLVPLVLLVASGVIVRRDAQRRADGLATPRDQQLKRDALFTLLSFTAMLMWEFLAHGLALEMTYYFSYMLPGIVLLTAGLINRWSRWDSARSSRAWLSAVAVVGAGVVPVFVRNSPSLAATLRTVVAPYMVAMVLVILAATVTKQSKILCVLLAFYTTSSFALSPHIYQYFSQQGSVNRGAHFGGIRLIAELHRQIPPGTRFAFWFRSSPKPVTSRDYKFESITSLYLGRWNLVNKRMPDLTAEDIDRIAEAKAGFIVLLADNPEEFVPAVDSLSKHGLEPRAPEYHTITEPALSFQYLIVQLRSIPDLQSPVEGRVHPMR